MNEQTEALIRELADKLGTTSEHLWGVLVRQAPITGIVNLLVLITWGAVMLWAFRFVRTKTKRPKQTKENPHPCPEWDEEYAFLAWFLWGVAAALTLFIGGAVLSGIVAALINPEYWALKEVLP